MRIIKSVGLDLKRFIETRNRTIAEARADTDIVSLLDLEGRHDVQRLSGVFRARYAGFGSCLGSLVAKLTLTDQDLNRDSLGVIFAGCASHIPSSWKFAERAMTSGPGLVNPAEFPHLLPSAIAVTISATINSHGPALAVGHERDPFSKALDISELLISGDVTSHCLVISVSQSDWPCLSYMTASDEALTYPDGAIAVLLGGDGRVVNPAALNMCQEGVANSFLMPPGFGEAIDFWRATNINNAMSS
jgi:hypothetical protein